MPSFMLCPPDEAAIVVVQADKANVANTARSERDARSLSAVIEISFLTELNHATSAAIQVSGRRFWRVEDLVLKIAGCGAVKKGKI